MSDADQGAEERADGLSVERRDSVLAIALDKPAARNALDDSSLARLIETLEQASVDDSLRAVLISGAGEHFCGGFDIVGRNANVDRNAARSERPRTGSIGRRLPTAAHRLLPLLLELQLPVVCAVRGWAVGIGAQIAVAADFTVVSNEARLWWPFVDRGFTPDSASTWLLPRIVGPVRARELLLLGRKISGREAADWGLVHAAVPDAEVDSAASALIDQLAHGPTVALGLTKALLSASPDNGLARHLAAEAAAMELSSRSPDFREGLAALVQKRKPEFGGR